MDSPQAIFTSFKLPKPSTSTPSSSKEIEQPDSNDDRSNSPTPSVNKFQISYALNIKIKFEIFNLVTDTRFQFARFRHLYGKFEMYG